MGVVICAVHLYTADQCIARHKGVMLGKKSFCTFKQTDSNKGEQIFNQGVSHEY